MVYPRCNKLGGSMWHHGMPQFFDNTTAWELTPRHQRAGSRAVAGARVVLWKGFHRPYKRWRRDTASKEHDP